MSASIYWRPISTNEQQLSVFAPSMFLDGMKRAFGDAYPWRLSVQHLEVLRGMAAMNESGFSGVRNPFEQIIDKITNDGENRTIEVWPEY